MLYKDVVRDGLKSDWVWYPAGTILADDTYIRNRKQLRDSGLLLILTPFNTNDLRDFFKYRRGVEMVEETKLSTKSVDVPKEETKSVVKKNEEEDDE